MGVGLVHAVLSGTVIHRDNFDVELDGRMIARCGRGLCVYRAAILDPFLPNKTKARSARDCARCWHPTNVDPLELGTKIGASGASAWARY